MNIKVIYSSGGSFNTDPEQSLADDDTSNAAEKISDTLKSIGHNVDILKITPDKINEVKKLNTDVVFNMCEWSGKDYHLGIRVLNNLSKNNIAYTGADAKSYDWCCDKIAMKRMFDKLNIPTPNWVVVNKTLTKKKINEISKMRFPVIMKPAWEHCAIGIHQSSVVESAAKAVEKVTEYFNQYKEPILIEEYIDGREFTVTVVKNGKLTVFPPAELLFKEDSGNRKFLSFDAKWMYEDSQSSCYEIKIIKGEKQLEKQLRNISEKAFTSMKCRGYTRIDFRVRDGVPYVLEINVNPSIDPDPLYGLTASTEAAGWDFSKLVSEIIKSAKVSPN